MSRLIRLLLLSLVVAGLVWAVVVWRWQQIPHAVGMRDMAMYLAVLPLLVVCGALALRSAWRRAAQVQAAAALAASAQPLAAASSAPVETCGAMHVLAQGVACAGADDAAAALNLLADSPPAQLDMLLRDADGMGVFTRRCAQIDVDVDGSDRVLALVQRCIEPVFRTLRELIHAVQASLPPGEPEPEHPTLVLPPKPQHARPVVRVLWGLPETAESFVQATTAGLAAALVRAWSQQLSELDWHLDLRPVPNGEALLLQAEQRLLTDRSETREEMVLLIAAESMLDEVLVERLDATGQLFTARRQGGVMPGEAAAALLLAPSSRNEDATRAALLHRLSAQRRDASADNAGRISAGALADTLRRAIAASGLDSGTLALVVADTDMRSPRIGELFDALQMVAPHLAAADMWRCSGAAVGGVGIASAPLALALAATHVQRRGEATLMLSHSDPFQCLAVVLSASRGQT
jgi:hypothetical protein